jgi:hypothetical protein
VALLRCVAVKKQVREQRYRASRIQRGHRVFADPQLHRPEKPRPASNEGILAANVSRCCRRVL